MHQLCCFMSCSPKCIHSKQEHALLVMGGMVGKHHSVSAVFILLLNGQKYKQKKNLLNSHKNPPGILCAWLTTHPSPSSFCLRERRPLSHACQKAGGNNSPGGVSHRGPPAEPGTPCGGEWEPSPPLLLKALSLYALTLISLAQQQGASLIINPL